MTDAAMKNASEAISNNNIGFTATVSEFEYELASFGLSSPVCVSSGSAGLVVALKALKIGKGDEVVLPRQTFIATGLAVLEVGATPVFCDINLNSGMLDLDSVARLINGKTRAIIYVHWGGISEDTRKLRDLAFRNNIGFIEDAAHAFGSKSLDGTRLGNVESDNHFIVFSFQAIKFFSTGDGGCICSSPKHFSDLKALSWFGVQRDSKQKRRSANREFGLNVTLPGYKHNMNAIQASIGLGNLKNIHDRIRLRRNRAKVIYHSIIESKFLTSMLACESQLDVGVFWFFPMLCKHRSEFIEYLNKCDVPSSTIDYRIDVNPIFTDYPTDDGIMQRSFDEQFLALPLGDHIPCIEIRRFGQVCKEFRP